MIDCSPFLAAIREHPNDVHLRRVWADSLEQRGDCPYAEIVRLACDCFEYPAVFELPDVREVEAPNFEHHGWVNLSISGRPFPLWLMAGDYLKRYGARDADWRRLGAFWKIIRSEQNANRTDFVLAPDDSSGTGSATAAQRAGLWNKLQAHLNGRDIYADMGIPADFAPGPVQLNRPQTPGNEIVLDRFYGLHTLNCSWDYWQKHAAAILAAHPLRQVQLPIGQLDNQLVMRSEIDRKRGTIEYRLHCWPRKLKLKFNQLAGGEFQNEYGVIERLLKLEWPEVAFTLTGTRRNLPPATVVDDALAHGFRTVIRGERGPNALRNLAGFEAALTQPDARP